MSGLMLAEWLKLRNRWMPRIIVLILLGINALIFWGTATNNKNRVDLLFPRGLVAALFFAALFSAFLWPVLGGSWSGNEYGWGTIRMLLSRRPDRIEMVVAALAVLLLGVAAGLIAVLILATIEGVIIS